MVVEVGRWVVVVVVAATRGAVVGTAALEVLRWAAGRNEATIILIRGGTAVGVVGHDGLFLDYVVS